MNLDQARFFMVEQQIRPWDVLDPQVLDLLENLPRHQFVAESQQKLAYSDIELPIGEGQQMLAPKIEAKIMQAIDVAESDEVLEIGTGSGYMTALLASLAQSVTTVELFESLQTTAKTRLGSFDNIKFYLGDASQTWNDLKDYDVIVLTGSCSKLPDSYKTKLKLGGRLFAIVGQSPAMEALLVTRLSEHEWLEESLFETVAPPLVNAEAKQTFKF
ncbi:protein-L-isoaspartate O-methyltransferase [Thiomicrospira microaerophila]|uniref:protein-L-isoaspartate O-methyltransferase family protein n=1 Tax=Thiomicrospira microaerophila TaxID=406020 RepID=UPI00200D248F|nr:protein-L-isoaspartate O-methyltransferase [Thiomicrospira microaerophila]UQB41600.1 protein-L-isoaspartate O-methyltransferase [Thiomicrospira microaerophila]